MDDRASLLKADVNQAFQEQETIGIDPQYMEEARTMVTYLDISENIVSLRDKVRLHKGLLPSAIPQIEDEVA